eukprot:scaffold8862_cov122-Isochrysis_galbana.AAC.9
MPRKYVPVNLVESGRAGRADEPVVVRRAGRVECRRPRPPAARPVADHRLPGGRVPPRPLVGPLVQAEPRTRDSGPTVVPVQPGGADVAVEGARLGLGHLLVRLAGRDGVCPRQRQRGHRGLDGQRARWRRRRRDKPHSHPP